MEKVRVSSRKFTVIRDHLPTRVAAVVRIQDAVRRGMLSEVVAELSAAGTRIRRIHSASLSLYRLRVSGMALSFCPVVGITGFDVLVIYAANASRVYFCPEGSPRMVTASPRGIRSRVSGPISPDESESAASSSGNEPAVPAGKET